MTYIPRGFDPYALPLVERSRPRDRYAMASKYAYAVSDVVRRSAFNYKTEAKPEGWVNVDFRVLEHYVGSKYAGKVLQDLMVSGLIERRWHKAKTGKAYRYKDGQATQYRLTSEWRESDLERFELHPSYLRKVELHAEAMRLDTFAKYPHLENTFHLLESVDLNDGWREVVPGVDDPHRRASYLFSSAELQRMEAGRFIFKLGPKGGRLFHPLAWTPRVLRDFVTVDAWEGENLALVDVSNSQPLMLAACVAASMDTSHPLRTFEPFAKLGIRDPRELQMATLERREDPWRDLATAFAKSRDVQVLENQQIELFQDPENTKQEDKGEKREGNTRGRYPKCTEPAAPENTGNLTDPEIFEAAILDSCMYLMSATLPDTLERCFTLDGLRWYTAKGQVFEGDRYSRKTPLGYVEPWDVVQLFVHPDKIVAVIESQGCELTPVEEWSFIRDAAEGKVYERLQDAMSARVGRDVSRDETKQAFMHSMAFHDPRKLVPGVSFKFDGVWYRGWWERVFHETYPEAFALGRWVRACVGNEGFIQLLQRIESELVLGRVLGRLDGWAIPIHDALVVPASDARLVVQIFKDEARDFLRLDLPLKTTEMGNLWTSRHD